MNEDSFLITGGRELDPYSVILAIFCAVVTAAAVAFFIRDQRRRGRFARFAAYSVDRAWIESRLLPIPAEVAGAACDDAVGPGEVKAILWRLTREQKIALEDGDPFRLRLLVSRDTFTGADAALVRALFVTGEAIDRESLVKYWEKRHELVPGARYEVGDLPEVFGRKTFDPADEISDDLLDDAHRLLDGTYGQPREAPSRALFSDLTPDDGKPAPPERVRDFMSWPYVAVLALAEYSRNDPDNRRYRVEPIFRFETEMLLLLGWGTHLAAKWLADRVRRKPSLVWSDAILFVLPLLVMPVAALIVDTTATGRFVLALFYAGSLLNIVLRARSGIAAHHTTVRQDLARARDFLRAEAARGSVPEAWIPYLLAFDIIETVDGVWSEDVSRLLAPFVARHVGDD